MLERHLTLMPLPLLISRGSKAGVIAIYMIYETDAKTQNASSVQNEQFHALLFFWYLRQNLGSLEYCLNRNILKRISNNSNAYLQKS